jgi:arylsulfatase A-like enzyme
MIRTACVFLFAALALFPPSADAAGKATRRPNILFLLADDLGSGDLGCYNRASKIPTPNIDRLAAQGIRLTDAHTPSAVCTPTRYGILTGRYCWRTRLKQGVLWGYNPLLIEQGRLTVPALLRKQGYATYGIGKWHLGLGDARRTDYAKPLRPGPLTVGFESYFGIPASLDMPPYLYFRGDRPVEAATRMIEASKSRREGGAGFWRAGPIAPGFRHEDVLPRLAKEAVAVLERHARQTPDKPFFLYLALTAPHTPWLPTSAFHGKSKAGPYGDFTVQVDAVVGQVAETLRKLKMEENTLLIFTSDNGAHWTPADIKRYGHSASNHRRGQKADAWEGGHRVPLLARWPGKIKPGSTSDELVCLTDLLATCAELLGATLPGNAGEDSESLLPLLLGRKRQGPTHEAVVHHSGGGLFAIRQGDWKLIDGLGSGGFSAPHTEKPRPGGPRGQLYNLATDPAEKENVYNKEPQVVKRLTVLLKQYQEQGHSARRLAK